MRSFAILSVVISLFLIFTLAQQESNPYSQTIKVSNDTSCKLFLILINNYIYICTYICTYIYWFYYADQDACYVCTYPCGMIYCCPGPYPQCCVVNGYCHCCLHWTNVYTTNKISIWVYFHFCITQLINLSMLFLYFIFKHSFYSCITLISVLAELSL